MSFDFDKIKARKAEERVINPVEIFQKNKGKITDGNINDLWLGQGDALREWHDNRNESDIAIVLNTGAGKTLIGLLVAQSLVNETRGKVVYACGSIQLIEQTREKAEGYGLNVTTYYGGNFSNDLFHQGEAVCLTTYQAIFNGKSIFQREHLEALIFDDAHTADGIIKGHFSIDIDRTSHGGLYDALTGLFRDYYKRIGRLGSFDKLYRGENSGVELLPPSIVKQNEAEIRRLLTDSGILESDGNPFAWEYLMNHIDLCCFLVSTGRVQITPPFIPISGLSYFRDNTRRVYLSATMLGADAFIRTFGRELSCTVRPETPAGECERLILFPGRSFGYEEELHNAKQLVANRKALVLTPSRRRAQVWEDIGFVPDTSQVVDAVAVFKATDEEVKLVLAGRYDGIDLPGDTCRYLVLDSLPSGTSLYDRFLWSSLNLSGVLRSLISSRVVQSLGRISRGMSDFGVVLMLEKEYVNWLLVPRNLASLPPFVQKQLRLGMEVSVGSASIEEMSQAIDAVLTREMGWSGFYERFMDDCDVEDFGEDLDILREFALLETKFARLYWERDYTKAASVLQKGLDKALDYSANLGAWYCLWIGYCLEQLGDPTHEEMYKRAYGLSKATPKHLALIHDYSDQPVTDQVSNVVDQFGIAKGSQVVAPQKLHENLKHLDGGGSVAQIEEAIRCLGQLLGLDSSRPDKEFGTGPDNLWMLNGVAFALEAKTAKDADVPYSKKYVGQLVQHVNWVADTHDPDQVIPAFIGPKIKAHHAASPSDEILVAELAELESLSNILCAAYEDIAAQAMPISLPQTVDEVFRDRGLVWPDVMDKLSFVCLKDIQD